jgi:hypothetical protein
MPKASNPGPHEQPRTLQEAIVTFSDPNIALKYAVALRWPDGIYCPRCKSTHQVFRFNNRGTTDYGRFVLATRSIVGKHITYEQLTHGHLELYGQTDAG